MTRLTIWVIVSGSFLTGVFLTAGVFVGMGCV